MAARTKKASAPFIGRWRIVEMEQWDHEFIDLEGPGHITFAKGGNGSFHFGAVQGYSHRGLSPHQIMPMSGDW